MPPSREAFEAIIDASLGSPEGLDLAMGLVDDMWKRGFDLQRLYFEPMQAVSLLGLMMMMDGWLRWCCNVVFKPLVLLILFND